MAGEPVRRRGAPAEEAEDGRSAVRGVAGPAPGADRRDRRDFEATALAGKLSEAQLDAIVEKFVHTSDVGLIARTIDVPRALVLQALEDGTLAERALNAKRNAATVRFLGLAIDRLLGVLSLPPSQRSTNETLTASKLLRDLLGLRATDRLDRPTVRNPRAPKEPADQTETPTPESKLGALERALLELGD